MTGIALLKEYGKSQAEDAFGRLVRRFTNLVYSVARRRTSNDAQAQEITQLVFIRLARTPPRLENDAELIAWLHRATVNASVDLWRSESRRRLREEKAFSMHLEPSITDDAWHALAPALDQALNELAENDRQAVLLRFFQQQSMRELGSAMGISEDAAKMRVSRALERLRAQLSRLGVTCGTASLMTLLTERAVEAAPTAFADSLAAFPYPVAGAGWLGIFGAFLATSPATKLAVTASAVVLVGSAVLLSLRSVFDAKFDPRSREGLPIVATTGSAPATVRSSSGDLSENAAAVAEPDPLRLLLQVANGRKRLVSGTMEYRLFTETFYKPVRETNYWRFKAAFDGSRIWLESFGREYRYVGVGSEASKAADPIIEAQGLDREAAVKAGLLEPFEAHLVAAADGTNWMRYRETDGRSDGVIVDDPKNTGNSGERFFDFRCLGLAPNVHYSSTIDGCLGYVRAKSIKLIGRENIDGTEAWHVRVIPHYDQPLDYWIDVSRPERLLKRVSGRDMVVSRFDSANRDPLPSEVYVEDYNNGPNLRFHGRYTRMAAALDTPVDPTLWTLSGLGLPIGTAITDVRVRRRIGYWNGAGLSASPPPASPPRNSQRAETAMPVDRAELAATLEAMPESEAGFDAAEWILLNTPDSPEVERAAEVIQTHHLASPRLLRLARELERFRHRSARPLLEGMLRDNPNANVRLVACFALATMLKDQCDHGKDAKATAEAEKMFERVLREFSTVPPEGPMMAERARRDLAELRTASIGKPAPDFTAEDFEGQSVQLSALRGQTVVLVFWSGFFAGEQDNHRAVEELVARKAVKFVGINMARDREKARTAVEQMKFSGPNVWDGRDGPIATAWNVQSWPTVVVVDPGGTIRYRGSYTAELHRVLEQVAGM